MSYIVFRHGMGQPAPSIKQAVEDMERKLTRLLQRGRVIDYSEPCILVKGMRVRRYLRTYKVSKRIDETTGQVCIALRPAAWFEGQRDDLVGMKLEYINEMGGR